MAAAPAPETRRARWLDRIARWKRVLLPYRVDRRSGERVALGNRGEALAVKHLKAAGYKILGRNVTLRFGEIDIVAEDAAGLLVIVEVKAAKHHDDPRFRPERHVNAAKRRKLVRLARALRAMKGWSGRPCRIDVIAVEFFDDGTHHLRHHVNAMRVGR